MYPTPTQPNGKGFLVRYLGAKQKEKFFQAGGGKERVNTPLTTEFGGKRCLGSELFQLVSEGEGRRQRNQCPKKKIVCKRKDCQFPEGCKGGGMGEGKRMGKIRICEGCSRQGKRDQPAVPNQNSLKLHLKSREQKRGEAGRRN